MAPIDFPVSVSSCKCVERLS
ncbi:hypothetical protein CCACVL1_04010, partial [Corchorus capsularis]